ncbi:MAG: hypothetical protein EUB_03503 [Eubacterium sp.]|uniref:Lar family restriction alleviation protein n=1 Tax=Eubacterium sp. TaxID=142586 RepID=UPI0030408B8D
MTKLKRCPFCGGEAKIRVERDYNGNPRKYTATCTKEYCPGRSDKSYDSEKFAILFWNQRTPEIVWCGECVYWEPENCRNPNILMRDQQMTYDDFCSWGERREENE